MADKAITREAYCLTDVGRIRRTNEDSSGIIEGPNFTLLAVCDGMGGHRKGEVASRLALECLNREFGNLNTPLTTWKAKKLLKKCCQEANYDIYNKAESDPTCFGMGTTAVIALVMDKETMVANIGDSRCYELRKNRKKIKMLTTDQSYVELLYERGKITRAQMQNHPSKNILTNALGIRRLVKVDIRTYENNYKYLLLCSDGLTNMVPENQITMILKRDDPLSNKCLSLVNRANDLGGYDNISVALLERIV